MSIKRYLLAGLFVGTISVVYNFMVFTVFKFYPDELFEFIFWPISLLNFYVLIFLKNFFVGLILMTLFSVGYRNIELDNGSGRFLIKGIFFLILYGIFALISFSVGDMFLMRTNEGMLVLLTIDGSIETLIATIPIRFFYHGGESY